MTTTREIEERIRKFSEIGKIVLSMKSIASSNVRRAQSLIDSLREFEEGVVSSVKLVLSYFPELNLHLPEGKTLVVVFGSDQGLCGSFNDKLAEKVTEEFVNKEELVGFLIVGRRLSDLIGERKLRVFSAPTHYESIYPRASELIEEISRFFLRGVSRIYTVFNEFTGVGSYRPVVSRVFPFEVSREEVWGIPPVLDIPPQEVLSGLITDYVFSRVYRAYLESFLSENGVRLMNMNSASSAIERTIGELEIERNYYRQEEITTEIEEIMTAFKLLGGER
ncbi:F0F1 ATP synthase subunit gamma [Hydrogenivirga sp.]